MSKNKICGVYKITSPSGKIYIGQSRSINTRFSQYLKLEKSILVQTRLYRSFVKYGVESHIFEIVEECLFDDLNKRERYWQDFYDVIGENGLNCVLTNTDVLPRMFSEEMRAKMSESRKGEGNNMYGRKGIDSPAYGKKGKNSPSYGRKPTKESLMKRKKSLENYKLSESHKKIISDRQVGCGNCMYGKSGKDSPVAKLVINLETGVFHYSVVEASDTYSICYSTLVAKLNGYRRNNTNLTLI